VIVILLLIAVASGVGLFLLILPQGLLIALIGALLGGSALTALVAVLAALILEKRAAPSALTRVLSGRKREPSGEPRTKLPN
jgi:ribosomal protein S12 methylthiotransferase accessory factor YcaO